MSKQTFKVILTTLTEHEYEIPDMNSEEEAISVGEQLFEDGDEGSVTNQEVVSWDAYPEDSEEED